MIPRSRAESADQMYEAMFVGDVYFARTPSADPLSAVRPVFLFVIISNECHVASAYAMSVASPPVAADGAFGGFGGLSFAWTPAAGAASATTAAIRRKRFMGPPSLRFTP